MIAAIVLSAALSHPCHDCPPPPPAIVTCFEEAARDKAKINECKARWIAASRRTDWKQIAKFWQWIKSAASGRS